MSDYTPTSIEMSENDKCYIFDIGRNQGYPTPEDQETFRKMEADDKAYRKLQQMGNYQEQDAEEGGLDFLVMIVLIIGFIVKMLFF